jgi:HSP20 family molecular chaperone IbpA
MDVKQISKHFDKFGEMVTELFEGLDGVSTFGGQPENAGVKVTKSRTDSEHTVVVEVEVPGCSSAEVEVGVESGRLSIEWTPRMTGKRQSRSFSISKDADVDHIVADVKNGYLTVIIPGLAGKTGARKVAVRG